MSKNKIICIVVTFVVTLSAWGCRTIGTTKDMVMVDRRMVVTGYCKCGKCCGWERNLFGRPVYSAGPRKGKRKEIGITASGDKASHGTIAADPRFPFGTVMYVPGYGYGRVEDRGGDIVGNHIDLYFSTHERAKKWGRQVLRVKIWTPAGR